MAAKLELSGIYRTQRHGSDLWQNAVFIPIKKVGQENTIVGVRFFLTKEFEYLNDELYVKVFKEGTEMVSKIRDPKKVYNSLFDQIFRNVIIGIEDPYGWV